MTTSRTLMLLRHAKSSWNSQGMSDHSRPLAPRGHRATEVLCEYLSEYGQGIDRVLCSTATRTRETWGGISDAFVEAPEVTFEDELYGAPAHGILAAAQASPDDVNGLMIISHNPGTEMCAGALVGWGKLDAISQLSEKYPTGGLATFAFVGAWADLEWGQAELVDFVVPRDLDT